jgi:hypothetical protein
MSDASTPITTSRVLSMPKGHRIYSTSREVATEFPLPAIGAVLAANNFIGGFTNHIVLDVTEAPGKGNLKRVTVTHGTIPSGDFTEYESEAYTFPPIYPNDTTFMPGGSRPRSRNVIAKVVYQFQLTIGSWLNDPTIWTIPSDPSELTSEALSTGPFEVRSYIAEAAGETFVAGDGSSGRVGDYLNGAFINLDTINDSFSIYDPGDLFYSVGASVPSATTYAGWVAAKTEIMTARTVHKWYCGYMRRTAFVRAQ